MNITPETEGQVAAVIPFHGSAIRAVREGDKVLVALKPICEHLGISWGAQNRKLATDRRFNCAYIPMPASNGKVYKYSCLPQDQLAEWLLTINPNKVAPEAQALLMAYRQKAVTAISAAHSELQDTPDQATPDAERTTIMQTENAETALIPFHGSVLRAAKVEGQVYVAIKPVCQHLGVDWGGQRVKLASDERFKCRDISVVAEDGKMRSQTCLRQDQLLGWLYTINPNKVSPEVKPLLLAYQQETTAAINNYWTQGQATRPSVAPPRTQDSELVGRAALRHILEELDSSAARLEYIEQRLDDAPVMGERLGEVYKLGQELGRLIGFAKAWRLFKDRFGLASYRDLPNREYEAALQFLRYQIISYGGHVPDRLL